MHGIIALVFIFAHVRHLWIGFSSSGSSHKRTACFRASTQFCRWIVPRLAKYTSIAGVRTEMEYRHRFSLHPKIFLGKFFQIGATVREKFYQNMPASMIAGETTSQRR
jgi:hypothetical protein